MAALTRSHTNVEEVETTPFAHKYLLKRPRLLKRSTTNSISLAPTVSHEAISNSSNRATHGTYSSLPDGPEIDNPAVERREYLLTPIVEG